MKEITNELNQLNTSSCKNSACNYTFFIKNWRERDKAGIVNVV